MTPSLRYRLLAVLLALFVLGWLSVTAATYLVASRRINELFDAELAHDASVLLYLVHTSVRQQPEPPVAGQLTEVTRHPKGLAFQIWSGSTLLLQSEDTPDLPFPVEDGYRDLFLDDQTWHAFTTSSADDGLRVIVAEPLMLRDELIAEIVHDALYPLVLAVPLLALLIWFGIGRGLVPMARLAQQVERRSPSFMQAVSLEGVPVELRPLIERLNALLQRLQEAFETERRFTADAAHEIRTPLAAVKTHAQVALRAADAGVRQMALKEIIGGVDRSTHLVEQLLTLARLDHNAQEPDFVDIDLVRMIREVAETIAPLATDRDVELVLEEKDSATVRGNRMALHTLFRNLLDNAVRYSPEHSPVQVRVHADAQGRVCVDVEDSGPGIPPESRERIFDRFYRGETGAGTAGCGLGLSISRRITDLHHAQIELADMPGRKGMRVRVCFIPQGG